MATSIISIDVHDEKFKAFAESFEKYKASLKDLPKGWVASGAAAGKAGADTEKSFKNLLKTNKDLNKSFSDGGATLKNVAKTSGEIAANFASTAASIAKWVSFSGIIGGFGLGALAANASNVSKQARGLGVTTGELRSADTNYGRYLGDPSSTLSKIADLNNDLSKRQILTRLGGKEGEDAAQQLPALFKNAVAQFKATGQNTQTADALGLTQVFDIQDLRRGAKATAEELDKVANSFRKDISLLDVSDSDSELMTNFWIQIKRSGEALETSFIKALAPLAPQLEALSGAVTKAITDFVGSKEVREALENFTKYLNSPEAKQDLRDFFTAIGEISKTIMSVVNFFTGKGFFGSTAKTVKDAINPFSGVMNSPVGEAVRNWFNPTPATTGKKTSDTASIPQIQPEVSTTTGKKTSEGHITPIQSTTQLTGKPQQFLSNVEVNNKIPQGVLDKMWAAESGRGKNMHSAVGAEGHFQFMPATAREYDLDNPYDFKTSAEAAAKKIKHLLNKYKGNIADALAAYNWGEGNLDKFIHGKSANKQLPKETNDYLHKFGITVNNAAGSDLVITSNGLK